MKVSLNWLREYVDIYVPVEDLAEKLTMAGFEVEDITTIGGEWDNIVIGQIVGVGPHPNADRLRLVTVDLGDRRTTVVCGAPNLQEGNKIVFASIGAKLIDGHTGEMAVLKAAKIRGVISEGMVCSEKELGLSDSHEGIMVLSDSAPVGVPLSDYMGDVVLEIGITPNRPDCLSITGIAREIVAQYDQEYREPDVRYDEMESDIESFASVKINESDLCPRYSASLITGVKIGPSPQWLQDRLLACGMRPISNVVDITNYVMLEYGQPLHSFDYEKIRGQKIIVRRGKKKEVITTLDGVERPLSPNVLVIADKERAVAIAGIMGGIDTEVTDDTTAILLESANFNQTVIHHGSIELKLSSEASLRFDKGLSRKLTLMALKRATQLMCELADGRAAKGIIDVYPGKQRSKSLSLSSDEVKQLLGIDITIEQIVDALTRLGFSSKKTRIPDQIKVVAPWWRTDITCNADLIEEVARIIGYENIPTTMLSASLPTFEPTPMLHFREKLRDLFVSCGFQEVITYALTSSELITMLSPDYKLVGPEPLSVANPMSRSQECLRTTIRPGLLTALARNQKYQQEDIRLVEIGKTFLPRRGELPEEKETLCAVLSGMQNKPYWRGEIEAIDFFVAKGVAETVISRLGLEAIFVPAEDESLLKGENATIIVNGIEIGVVGELHPVVAAAFDIIKTSYIIELDVDALLSLAGQSYEYRPVSRYPSTIRDIALIVDERVTYQQIVSIIQSFPLVSNVVLFDLYRGDQVPSGKKSLAFRITYQSVDHTLTDKEVNGVQDSILNRLEQELKSTLRA
jgi:phenylalanyl-tRNA synthetase beta chain